MSSNSSSNSVLEKPKTALSRVVFERPNLFSRETNKKITLCIALYQQWVEYSSYFLKEYSTIYRSKAPFSTSKQFFIYFNLWQNSRLVLFFVLKINPNSILLLEFKNILNLFPKLIFVSVWSLITSNSHFTTLNYISLSKFLSFISVWTIVL